jgi:SAM-dependent methyltransferase
MNMGWRILAERVWFRAVHDGVLVGQMPEEQKNQAKRVSAEEDSSGWIARWLDRGRYRDYGDRWDDDILRAAVLERLKPQHRLLDLGAGAGIVPEMNFRGHADRVCGVDPDERVVDNPFLDEGRQGVGESIPYEDESFDIVVSDNVLEHLDRPVEVFREVARVLKPGGIFLAKTPNRWHYVATAASLTPHGFHRWFNAKRGRAQENTFPTRYRANSRAQLTRVAAGSGLVLESCRLIEGRPEYLRQMGLLYLAGALYERIVNSTQALAAFRVILVAELRKPA